MKNYSSRRPRRKEESNFWRNFFGVIAVLGAIFFIGSLFDGKDDGKLIEPEDDENKKLPNEEKKQGSIENSRKSETSKENATSINSEDKLTSKTLSKNETSSNQTSLRLIEKDKIFNRLKLINERIIILEKVSEILKKKEKRRLLWARLILGLLVLLGNIWYLFKYNLPFDIKSQVAINTGGLLVYTFIAFLIYGSVKEFTKRTKQIYVNTLLRKNIDSFTELEILLKERVELKNRLNFLENFELINN